MVKSLDDGRGLPSACPRFNDGVTLSSADKVENLLLLIGRIYDPAAGPIERERLLDSYFHFYS
jgi:hypothetical protein